MKEAPNLEKRFFFFPFSYQIKPSPQISFTKRVDKANRPIETCCSQQRGGKHFLEVSDICSSPLPVLLVLREYRVGSGQHQDG